MSFDVRSAYGIAAISTSEVLVTGTHGLSVIQNVTVPAFASVTRIAGGTTSGIRNGPIVPLDGSVTAPGNLDYS